MHQRLRDTINVVPLGGIAVNQDSVSPLGRRQFSQFKRPFQSNVIDVGNSMLGYFSQVLSPRRGESREFKGREIRVMKE